MRALPTITMIVADTHYYGESISALRKSLTKVQPAATKFLTDIKAYNPNFPFEIVKIDKIEGKVGYSSFVIKELDKYFDTDFVLIVQHDGYVLDDNAWDEDFLNYDYIGAPWLESADFNVGNGGFSLRSKKLQHILATDDFIKPIHPEDNCICKVYRSYLEEKYGIKYAPDYVAEKFSFELREPNQPTFGFHGKFHKPYKPVVIVKRTGALGDCIALEPVLEHLHKSGKKVVIDIPLNLAMIYAQHHYPVHHITQFDQHRIVYDLIDLDGSYEKNPKQLHLKSYYESAGIENGEIKNPKLNLEINEQTKLFKKYAILHIDERDQKYRNIYGVNWKTVVDYLKDNGYDVIQLGLSKHEEIDGALWMNTPTTNVLLWAVAGADLFVGIDSGISNMAVATNVPAVIFTGSVNPEYIYPDLSNISLVSKGKVCNLQHCWHEPIGGVEGIDCYVDVSKPPCTQFTTEEAINGIKRFVP